MPVDNKSDFKMQPEEFGDLREQVRSIGLVDTQLGRVLDTIILHLGHLHGFDPVQEDAKARDKAEADEKARAATEKNVQAKEPENKQTQKGESHAI